MSLYTALDFATQAACAFAKKASREERRINYTLLGQAGFLDADGKIAPPIRGTRQMQEAGRLVQFADQTGKAFENITLAVQVISGLKAGASLLEYCFSTKILSTSVANKVSSCALPLAVIAGSAAKWMHRKVRVHLQDHTTRAKDGSLV